MKREYFVYKASDKIGEMNKIITLALHIDPFLVACATDDAFLNG